MMIGTAKLQVIWRVCKTCRKLCHEMIKQHGIDRFRPVTGLPVSTYFSAFKVKWLLDNVAEVSSAMAEGDAMIGTVDTWLIYNLTGGVGKGSHVTDGVAHCLHQLCKASSRMHRVSPDAYFCPPRPYCALHPFCQFPHLSQVHGMCGSNSIVYACRFNPLRPPSHPKWVRHASAAHCSVHSRKSLRHV